MSALSLLKCRVNLCKYPEQTTCVTCVDSSAAGLDFQQGRALSMTSSLTPCAPSLRRDSDLLDLRCFDMTCGISAGVQKGPSSSEAQEVMGFMNAEAAFLLGTGPTW